jgi:hypothetical protein
VERLAVGPDKVVVGGRERLDDLIQLEIDRLLLAAVLSPLCCGRQALARN